MQNKTEWKLNLTDGPVRARLSASAVTPRYSGSMTAENVGFSVAGIGFKPTVIRLAPSVGPDGSWTLNGAMELSEKIANTQEIIGKNAPQSKESGVNETGSDSTNTSEKSTPVTLNVAANTRLSFSPGSKTTGNSIGKSTARPKTEGAPESKDAPSTIHGPSGMPWYNLAVAYAWDAGKAPSWNATTSYHFSTADGILSTISRGFAAPATAAKAQS